MGQMYIVNSPWIFRVVWAMTKGWLDEHTRNAITVCEPNFLPDLCKVVDIKQIPTWLGGENERKFEEDYGPWNEYELVDGTQPGSVVGVYRKDDPTKKVFTPIDLLALTNPNVKGKGISGSRGAMIVHPDGRVEPNLNPLKPGLREKPKQTQIA